MLVIQSVFFQKKVSQQKLTLLVIELTNQTFMMTNIPRFHLLQLHLLYDLKIEQNQNINEI
jgi:hypothetical protein